MPRDPCTGGGNGNTALVLKPQASLNADVVPGKGILSHSSLNAGGDEEGSGGTGR